MAGRTIADCGLRIAEWGKLAVLACATTLGSAAIARADDYAERAAKVEQLTSAEKTELLRKKQRFDELAPEEKERLRELHAKISTAPDAAELEKLMGRYCDWLKNLSSLEKAEVQSLPPEQRIARIKEIVSRQEGQRFSEYVKLQLPKEDRDAIYKWLDDFVEEHEQEIIDRLPHDDRRRMRDIDGSRARRRALIQQLPWRRWNDPKMPYPSSAETEQMLAGLSAETRKQLEGAAEDQRINRANELVGAAIWSIAFPPPSEEDLRKYYLSLSTEVRARLDGMDADATQKELMSMYRKNYRSRGGPWGWQGGGQRGDGRGGDGERRGDGRGEGRPPGPHPGPPPPGLASPK